MEAAEVAENSLTVEELLWVEEIGHFKGFIPIHGC